MNQIIDKEIIINGQYPLAGTLSLPQKTSESLPLVIIVNGSGGMNRDGNVFGFKSNRYKMLSHLFLDMGYATLRYDKRGVAKSKGRVTKTGMWDLIDDIRSSIDYARSLGEIDSSQIYLCGHSEGCILSTLVSKKEPLAGMILLSGAGTSIRIHMERQQTTMIEEVKGEKGLKGFLLRLFIREKGATEKQEKAFKKVIESNKDAMLIQGKVIPAKWLREHLNIDNDYILSILAKTSIPVLAITGDKDVQTDSSDLVQVKALDNPNIETMVIENMDHMLVEFKGEKTILNLGKQYKKSTKRPIHSQLVKALEDFLVSKNR